MVARHLLVGGIELWLGVAAELGDRDLKVQIETLGVMLVITPIDNPARADLVRAFAEAAAIVRARDLPVDLVPFP